MPVKLPKELTGAELQSMLKSNVNFKSLGGMRVEGLKLGESDLKWWRDARIGMFIHWGLYSVLGRGEWARFNEKIPYASYESLSEAFDPNSFSTDEWMEIARTLGAKYCVMVTRHHDGFSLWDSPFSYNSFTSVNSAAKRDFVSEFTDSCRKYGMRCGYYYSPMDWRFPGYFDPVNLRENAEKMKRQCYGQVEELVTKYGAPDILWYDGGWLAHKGSDTSSAWFWEPDKLNKMVRQHAPKAVINPRSGWEGDFYCDEGSNPISGGIITVPWEKGLCLCSGVSWGWMEEDPVQELDWLVRMLVNVIGRDGNILWNIAPDRNGKLSEKILCRIEEFGSWIKLHSEAIYSTRGGPLEPVDGVYVSTFKENNVYLFILDKQSFSELSLAGLPGNVLSVSKLDGTRLPWSKTEGIKIDISSLSEALVPVIRISLDRAIKPVSSEVYFTGRQ